MSLLTQHILVLALVAVCLVLVARQAFASLRGKPGKIGNCCSQGCQPSTPAAKTERIVFLPVEMLTKKR